jgi:hypothetical protein
VERHGDADAVDAFRAGYRGRRDWPLDDPALRRLLSAARALVVANLTLHLRRPGWRHLLSDIEDDLRAWMIEDRRGRRARSAKRP